MRRTKAKPQFEFTITRNEIHRGGQDQTPPSFAPFRHRHQVQSWPVILETKGLEGLQVARHGRKDEKLERYGRFSIIRPEPQAMGSAPSEGKCLEPGRRSLFRRHRRRRTGSLEVFRQRVRDLADEPMALCDTMAVSCRSAMSACFPNRPPIGTGSTPRSARSGNARRMTSR